MDNINFGKPINKLSDEELHRIINNSHPNFAAVALTEIQRRRQAETDTKLKNKISSLIKETKVLQGLIKQTDKTSKETSIRDRNLARTAIFISVLALIVQTALSIKNEVQCRYSFESPEKIEYSDCQRRLDLGVVGTKYSDVPDIVISKNNLQQ